MKSVNAKTSRNKKVTLREVASLAGCSVATASKALTGQADVSANTRTEVNNAAFALGYQRKPRKANRIDGLFSVSAAFDTYGSLYSSELLSGALAAASKAGIELNVTLLPDGITDETVAKTWVNQQSQLGHFGALLVTSSLSPTLIKEAGRLNFNLVAIDPKHQLDGSIVSIGSTNWAGGSAAAEYAISLGHKRIAFVGLDKEFDLALERFAGFQSALTKADLSIFPELIFQSGTDFHDGFSVGKKISRMSNPPTAVCCLCDAIAFGVLEAARQKGVKVPEDMSVIGFDDVTPARWSSPALTTIRQPMYRMGNLAVRTLLKLARGEEPESHHVQLATNLVIRDSTGPLLAGQTQDS